MEATFENCYWSFDSTFVDIVSGVLQVDKNIHVTLLGCDDMPKEPFILYGNSPSGKKITLLNCYISEEKLSFPGIPQIKIIADYIFYDGHIKENDFVFTEVSFEISDLKTWLDISGFSFENKDHNTLNCTYKKPDSIILFESEEIIFKIDFIWYAPHWAPTNKLEVEQKPVVKIKYQKGMDLKTFFKLMSHIKSFFTIASFSDVKIDNITFFNYGSQIKFNYNGQYGGNYKIKSHRSHFYLPIRM